MRARTRKARRNTTRRRGQKIELNKIYCVDALEGLKKLDDKSINCVVTSPPYWGLRDYGIEGQLGLEDYYEEYILKLCDIFDEIKRVLKDDGAAWVNIGETYGTSKSGEVLIETDTYARPEVKNFNKCLLLIPFRFSIEMIKRGWILRNTIIWNKPNALPSSVTDRFTVDFEYFFFFVRNEKYYFKQQFEPWKDKRPSDIQRAINEHAGYNGKFGSNRNNGILTRRLEGQGLKGQPVGNPLIGRNKRAVWKINTVPSEAEHFASYPEELIEVPLKACCPEGGIVLDPFIGTGTTALVAWKQNKNYIGFDINPAYVRISEKRLEAVPNTRLNDFFNDSDERIEETPLIESIEADL